jgi:hypothetical protein
LSSPHSSEGAGMSREEVPSTSQPFTISVAPRSRLGVRCFLLKLTRFRIFRPLRLLRMCLMSIFRMENEEMENEDVCFEA